MSEQERLAALLEAEIDGRLRLGKRSIRELAARLTDAGVHLDDGLRAAAEGVCVLWFDRLEPPDSQMFRAVMLDLRAALERKP